MKSYYGITLDDYDALFAAQNGLCAACGFPGIPRRDRLRPLVVDHDHQTGQVRGLLCNHCNVAIGMVSDDAARLRQLAEYLERW